MTGCDILYNMSFYSSDPQQAEAESVNLRCQKNSNTNPNILLYVE